MVDHDAARRSGAPRRPIARSGAFFIFSLVALGACHGRPLEPKPGESEMLQALEALGYVSRSPTQNPQDRGVTIHRSDASPGVNLYNSRHRAAAHLVSMDGRIVHTWADTKKHAWMHVEMQPNGDLFAIGKGKYLVKLDRSSKVRWRRKTRAHHDLHVGGDGHIHLLSRRVSFHKHKTRPLPVLEDLILVLAPNGRIRQKHPLLPILLPFIPKRRFEELERQLTAGNPVPGLAAPEGPGDLLHTNSIQILEREIPSIAPAGSILLSVREINRLIILDRGAKRVLWSWGQGELQRQHHATLLPSGRILVFDNGRRRQKSRVLEVNPTTQKTEWTFTMPGFYTALRGAAQRLPNGNVLATESDSGHVIEVTRDGRIVWEFWNPDVREGKPPTRAVIYRMTRYPLSYLAAPLALGAQGAQKRLF